ncbi:peptidoglycan DD-metalloendopeptidase family protein [Motilimonas eburnea]|uniref:peptidoglycan DD-metalloendopeptidase family protein n=1 Tax=Motilimonas eburnea TaxID=1737488 RepID=UPI001E29DBE3|nr:peptidoglycan DD-metalloendopeptidase family protein [Motilimonas eburnea]MCE2571419.1 peptidoglycan DD-metalloendopeptidase family protein [Motilimonas eburnea]
MVTLSLRWPRAPFILLILLLSACSANHTPAPVKTVGKYQKQTYGQLSQSVYQVKKGDTLFAIAWRAGRDYKDIAAYNRIKPPYTIFVGQKLKIPPAKYNASGTGSTSVKNQVESKKQAKQVKNTADHKNSKIQQKKLEQPKRKEYAEKNNNKNATTDVAANKITQWRWPTDGKIVARFSTAELGNKGIDIAGKRNQPVKASADGKVVYAGSALRGYGKLIIIKHNDDYLSAYAHNDKLLVKEQQTVKVGQLIAEMGSTGTTDVRLHFEIRYRGKSVDPLRFLPKK